nr:hypothetical protein [Tanacetum cinerariifolium]
MGTKWAFRNKKNEKGLVIRNKARLVAQRCTQEEGINYEEVFAPVARIEAIRMIEKEVYVCQPPRFEDPDYTDKVYKIEKALYGLHQAPRAWLQVKQKSDGIFISHEKYVDEILRKFNYEDIKPASTPMDKERLCSNIQMVMMLMFISTVKRIFGYLKGHPKLGLWYPKDSSFDLVAYTDSDYCKKQTVVATSTIEAEYMATASCCGQFWRTASVRTLDNREIKLNAIVDDQVKTITEASIRRHLKLADADGISTLPTTEIFKQLALMGAADKAITQEMHDRLGRATITATSLAAEQGSEIDKDENVNLVKSSEQGEVHETAEHRIDLSTAIQTDDATLVETMLNIKRSAAKDRGKAIMQESESPKKIKKKEMMQISLNEEIAQRMLKEERESLSIKERSRLLAEFINKRNKMMAARRTEEKRNKPTTHAQKRTYMSNYLKNIGGYTLKQLKQYSFKEIKMLFDNTMGSIKRLVPMESEGQAGEGSSKEGESLKRSAKEELGQEQKLKEEIAQQEDVEKESSKKAKGRLKRKTLKAREDKDKR